MSEGRFLIVLESRRFMPEYRRHKAEPKTLAQARCLREDSTPAERKLWRKLRDRQIHDCKFRRQFPVGPFIADFCCPERGLVVEIDGDSHADKTAEDAERTRKIEGRGYRVIRFTNSDIHERMRLVLEQIGKECEKA